MTQAPQDNDLSARALFDAYAPAQMAQRVEQVGVDKATMAPLRLLTLAVLAGAFIALGASFYLVAMTGHDLGFGPGRLLGGLAFSLGLVLVVVGGAELFTGNSLIVMAWADGFVSLGQLLYNWSLAFVGNLVGAACTALMLHIAGTAALSDGAFGTTAIDVAVAKTQLSWGAAFMRGVMCNVLVCLAVWLTFSARSATGKVLCVVFPITAFVALGFEHSIANLFFFPYAVLNGADLGWAEILGNLIPVTIGNVAGGGGLVALVYWSVYGRT